jgi:hypothetical protein
MSNPMAKSTAVKVSGGLAEAARKAAHWADRSVAGQIEHWARLGQAVEGTLSATEAAALKKSGGDGGAAFDDEKERDLVLGVLASIREAMPYSRLRTDVVGATRVQYEADPDHPSGIVKVSSDGSRTRGRLVGRKFVPSG